MQIAIELCPVDCIYWRGRTQLALHGIDQLMTYPEKKWGFHCIKSQLKSARETAS